MNNTKGPIFIVGCQRSGTTLFQLMITSHPNIAIPSEGDFIVRLKGNFAKKKFSRATDYDALLTELFKIRLFADWGLKTEELKKELLRKKAHDYQQVVETIYLYYLKRTFPKATRWGDKKPDNLYSVTFLKKLFPNSNVIHFYRDGRDVALSWIKATLHAKEHKTGDFPHGPTTIQDAALKWRSAMRKAIALKKRFKDEFMEIGYEEVLDQPESTLKEVCEFIGEPYNNEMLKFYSNNQEKELIPKRQLSWHSNTLKPLNKDLSFKWKSKLNFSDRLRFEMIAYEELLAYNYEVLPRIVVESARMVLKLKQKLQR